VLSKISIQRVADLNSAIGLASTYVAAHSPFGSYRADKLIGSIAGQIRRQHYAFAARDGKIVGYFGWALCSPDIAQAWLKHGQAPTYEQSNQGDVVVVIVAIADDTLVLRQLVAHLRGNYRGKIYMGRRAGRVDNAIRSGCL
jgi:hemolysin-activating ACP:hemolysin acyltransferase